MVDEIVKKFQEELKKRLEIYIDRATSVDDIMNLLFAITELKRKDFLTKEMFEELKEKSRKKVREIVYG